MFFVGFGIEILVVIVFLFLIVYVVFLGGNFRNKDYYIYMWIYVIFWFVIEFNKVERGW